MSKIIITTAAMRRYGEGVVLVSVIAGAVESETLGWRDVPEAVRAAVSEHLGSEVLRSLRQDGELAAGVTARLQLADGRWVLARAAPAEHPLVGDYRAEAAVTARLPRAVPTPRLLCSLDSGWVVVVTEDVDGVRPDLRPGSPDLTAVLATVSRCSRALTPCPFPDVPDALDDLGPLLRGWQTLWAGDHEELDPWAVRNLDSLLAIEGAWHPWAAGDTLLHSNLRPGRLIRVGLGCVLVTGWRYPARGAAWLDVVTLLPQLVLAGHEPAAAERLVLRRPELAGVPAWAVTGYAAALAGYLELVRRLPEPAGSVGLRARQAAEATAALRWVRHRTRWP